jgi:MFS family permease
MNVVYALSAYPAGALSDRRGRLAVLFAGLFLLLLADGVLALANEFVALAGGAALWGVHMGFTQGVFAALVADTAPPELRGTAYGAFNLVTGLALLVASLIAGVLWDFVGPAGTFLGGGVFTLISLAGLWRLRDRLTGHEPTGPRR